MLVGRLWLLLRLLLLQVEDVLAAGGFLGAGAGSRGMEPRDGGEQAAMGRSRATTAGAEQRTRAASRRPCVAWALRWPCVGRPGRSSAWVRAGTACAAEQRVGVSMVGGACAASPPISFFESESPPISDVAKCPRHEQCV